VTSGDGNATGEVPGNRYQNHFSQVATPSAAQLSGISQIVAAAPEYILDSPGAPWDGDRVVAGACRRWFSPP
jgi:hypothetical protein